MKPKLRLFQFALALFIFLSLFQVRVELHAESRAQNDVDGKAGTHRALTKQRRQQLLHLLHQDCGSCHGMTLKGGLGPPLLAPNLQNQSEQALTAVILFGRPTTAMPPWEHILSESEARWLARYLKNGGD